MAGINVGDTLQIGIEGLIDNQKTLNVLHYYVITPSSSPSYVTAMSDLLTDWLNSATGPHLPVLAAAAQNWTCTRVRGQRIWPTRDIGVVKLDGRPGTRPTDAATGNTAFVITKYGPLGARNNVGSFHLAGTAAGDFSASTITPATKVRLEAIAARFLTLFVSPTSAVSASLTLVPKANPSAHTFVIATQAQESVRVMRRRTLRVGE